jgi:hypothetical protein
MIHFVQEKENHKMKYDIGTGAKEREEEFQV